MSLFEIDLNANFKFNDKSAFLSEQDFNTFFKQNNLNSTHQTNEFLDLLIANNTFNVGQDSILVERLTYHRNEHEKVEQLISMNLFEAYDQHFVHNSINELTTMLFGSQQEKSLYSNWQLFYIGLKKQMFIDHKRRRFIEHLHNFKKISEIMYKEFLIRNIRHDLSFANNDERFEFETHLLVLLSEYKISVFTNSEELIEFLKYLMNLHYHFLENEQYKLMWNLESTYVLASIYILINEHELTYTEIVGRVNEHMFSTQQSDLNAAYVDLSTYLRHRSRSPYYAGQTMVKLLNTLFHNDLNNESIIDILNGNDRYLEILSSIVEINKRFFANKRSESTVLAVTIGVVLNVEIFIKDKSTLDNVNIFRHITNILSEGDRGLLDACEGLIPYNAIGNDFFSNYMILINKPDSVEKYFMLYKHARNYIAHTAVEFERFFYEEDRVVITNVLNAVIVVLFYLETL